MLRIKYDNKNIWIILIRQGLSRVVDDVAQTVTGRVRLMSRVSGGSLFRHNFEVFQGVLGGGGLRVFAGESGAVADCNGESRQLHEALAATSHGLLFDIHICHFKGLFRSYFLQKLDEIEVLVVQWCHLKFDGFGFIFGLNKKRVTNIYMLHTNMSCTYFIYNICSIIRSLIKLIFI